LSPEISTSDKKIIKAFPKNRIPEPKIKANFYPPLSKPMNQSVKIVDFN
jgi:hypothetical protein